MHWCLQIFHSHNNTMSLEEREIRDDVSDHSSEEGDDVMDSSEEEEDDDNVEEAQKIREGFIVDDDEEDTPERRRRKKHKKRRKEDHADALDEDDLELLLENSGAKPTQAGKFKRLKRAQADDETAEAGAGQAGLTDIFSDDNEKGEEGAGEERNILDEFEDFIEDDEFSDEDEARQNREARRKERAKKTGPRLDTSKLSSVDRESLQQLFEVFGNGAEYEWALEAQEIEDEGNGEQEPTGLEEVFEHAELKERMLTEEDNLIRIIDVPERFQKYRANMTYTDLVGDELVREQEWIGSILAREKGFVHTALEQPFRGAVAKVVEFVSKESLEVPFIWAHRRDFLLFTEETVDEEGNTSNTIHKLLYEDDLWRIVHLDIEYHSLYDKRKNVEQLLKLLNVDDDMGDINQLDSMVAVQDLYDYLNFTYSSELKKTDSDKRKHPRFINYERMRENILYDVVKAYGITAKQFGENVQDQSSKHFEVPYRIHATDDPLELPEDLIEKFIEDDEILYKDPVSALRAVRSTYADEIFHNPRIRHEVRQTFKNYVSISVALTEKGRSSIEDHSPYADIKYAINRSPADLVRQPDVLLRMLEAEHNGLVVLKVQTRDYAAWYQSIFNCLKSDGTSEISELWNKERDLALQAAFKRLTEMVAANTKEDLRRECERLVAAEVRKGFHARVNQAPFTPYGFDKGTKPNVLALSLGKGDFDNAVVGVFMRESGKIDDYFKSDTNPIRDRESEESFKLQLKEFYDKNLRQYKPDVIVISGFNTTAKRLYDIVQSFVQTYNIQVNTEELAEADASNALIPVIWGQDETARLYQNSERATVELSDKPSIVKYCVGLARYVQSPLLEYISLGDDILSLSFHEFQKLLPTDLVKETIEAVFVDIVNMVGVEINEALSDDYIAQLLPYVAGLGPRKASGLLRNINANLGTLTNRSDLIENEFCTANIFNNCSSFLNIPYTEGVRDAAVELLDATRIHPEDYDLARKMAADALDFDEEDMAHIEEQGGIIYQLMQEGVNKVDDLNLTAYGKELETKFGKKKYATLQSIKEELVNNFEELRRSFHVLESAEVFHMLTGETTETFAQGTIVPVTINRVGKNFRDPQSSIRFLKVTTSSLIQGSVEEEAIPRGADYIQGQVVQAVVTDVAYDTFNASFSLLEEDIKNASVPKFRKEPLKWDFDAEEANRQRELARERAKLAKTRNIQHPLFRNFNHKQAEEYLAPQAVGDCVLRPSSKGAEYLVVTWKVGNNLFQHLLIEERQTAMGKQYIVDGQEYADLDQLIFQHVQAIAKHVNEMCRNPKFREGALAEVHEWLESYTRANPRSSAYVFCYDHKNPGWFLLLFKVNVNTPISTWYVKTERDGYRLKGFSYPNMLRLCNGFKQTFKSVVRSNTSGQYNYGY